MMRLLTWTFSTLTELRNGKRAAQTMELWMHAGGCYARKKRKSRQVRQSQRKRLRIASRMELVTKRLRD